MDQAIEVGKLIGGYGLGTYLAVVLIKEFFRFFGEINKEKLNLQRQQFEAWQDDRRRVDALIAGGQQNSQATALALGDMKDNQHRIVNTLEKISEKIGDMDHSIENMEREIMLEVQGKRGK